MKEQLINLDGIDITLFKSKKAKNINITIRPFKGVRVSVPRFITFKKAKHVAIERLGWIRANVSKIQTAEANATVFNIDSHFLTRRHKLYIKFADVTQPRSILRSEKINILLPIDSKIENDDVQSEIKNGIEKAYRIEAKEFLPDRVEELAIKHHFKFRSVTIRNSKTRWGSCSPCNNINLSLHLMRLPDYLIDYVILHELVHTRVKDHSKNFWDMLDSVSGNAKAFDREIKEFNINIY